MISAAPIIWTPAVESVDEQPTEPSAPSPEQTMPEHLIFDYFTPADDTETEQTMPDQRAEGYPSVPVGAGGPPPALPPWAQASRSEPSVSASAASGPSAQAPVYDYAAAAQSLSPGPAAAATARAARPIPARPVPARASTHQASGRRASQVSRVSREGADGPLRPVTGPDLRRPSRTGHAARAVRAATRPVRVAQGRDRSVPGVG